MSQRASGVGGLLRRLELTDMLQVAIGVFIGVVLITVWGGVAGWAVGILVFAGVAIYAVSLVRGAFSGTSESSDPARAKILLDWRAATYIRARGGRVYLSLHTVGPNWSRVEAAVEPPAHGVDFSVYPLTEGVDAYVIGEPEVWGTIRIARRLIRDGLIAYTETDSQYIGNV